VRDGAGWSLYLFNWVTGVKVVVRKLFLGICGQGLTHNTQEWLSMKGIRINDHQLSSDKNGGDFFLFTGIQQNRFEGFYPFLEGLFYIQRAGRSTSFTRYVPSALHSAFLAHRRHFSSSDNSKVWLESRVNSARPTLFLRWSYPLVSWSSPTAPQFYLPIS